MSNITPVEGEVENVRVVVRVRPLSTKERNSGFKEVVTVDQVNSTVTVFNPHHSECEPPKRYTFDLAFGPESRQVDIYNETARPIVDKVLQGYNGTILAYGQTGTGKTFTMEGDCSEPELKGIIPNSFAHIFGYIAKAAERTKFLVRVGYIEIYNEEIRDLLSKDPKVKLEVKERPDIGVYIKDLSSYVINNADEMEKIMNFGKKNRAVGETAMNITSSRSHAIFTITIENSEIGRDGKQHIKMGKLHLVDLAGSERQSKTGASGQRLREATKINASLSVLGNVISALVDGKSNHIPYRNSKLTRLLQDSLGGNSKTVMCANIGPADYNYDETISTLRYANRSKCIRNRVKINENPKDAVLRDFQAQIEDLRRQLEHVQQIEHIIEESDEEDEEVIQRRQSLSPSEEKKDDIHQMEVLKHEQELKKAQMEHEQLRDKLKNMEKKILVGGENLLEKAELQERLLEASARELEERRRTEQKLEETLQQKEAELSMVEKQYSSLQEEAYDKTRRLKKMIATFLSYKAELRDLMHEQQREMEGLLDSVRALTKELRLQETIIDEFIPRAHQDKLEQYMHWNEDIGEWQLKCVAYTGNNMRKQQTNNGSTSSDSRSVDMSYVYGSYLTSQNSNLLSDSSNSRIARSARSRYSNP